MFQRRQVVNRINAVRYLKILAELETPQDQFYYLRGLNAFVFEEMILTALKKHGFKIIRNKRYTGDGGIDGRAYKNDQHYLIQAKRYRKHINPAIAIFSKCLFWVSPRYAWLRGGLPLARARVKGSDAQWNENLP